MLPTGPSMLALGTLDTVALFAIPIVGCMMLAYGVAQVFFDLRRDERKRVMDRLKRGGGQGAGGASAAVFDLRRKEHPAKGMLEGFANQIKFTQKLQTVLEQANVPWSAPAVLVKLTAAAVIAVALLLVLGVGYVITTGVGVAIFLLPLMYLFKRRKKRMTRLVAQLPDVFELLSQALRAGHSLASGMQLISKQVADPAGTEFARVFHEQNLGLKIEDALKNLAERTNMLDVRFFVTAVLIQRQTGGDLAEVLDKLGAVIRDRIKLFGTVKALTAEGRLSGYVLMALPPVVFMAMLFLNRDYAMMLILHPMGKMMLTAAATMQIMGWLIIKKIVNIKV